MTVVPSPLSSSPHAKLNPAPATKYKDRYLFIITPESHRYLIIRPFREVEHAGRHCSSPVPFASTLGELPNAAQPQLFIWLV